MCAPSSSASVIIITFCKGDYNEKIGDKHTNNIFENIKYIDEYGNEYWYARELSKVLEYKDWRNFLKVLNKAKEACKNSGFNIDEQLVEHNKLSKRNN